MSQRPRHNDTMFDATGGSDELEPSSIANSEDPFVPDAATHPDLHALEEYRGTELAEYLLTCYPAIILAGAIYPFVFAVLAISIGLILGGGGGGDDLPQILIFILFFSFTGAIIGATIAAITGAIAVALVGAINASTGYPIKSSTCGVAAGGMAGYIPTSWVLHNDYLQLPTEQAFAIFFGPVLAMVLGSCCAALFASRFSWPSKPIQKVKWQFRIRHLMVATGWFALIFGITNALGGIRFAALVAVWLALQTAFILVGRGIKQLLSTLRDGHALE